MQTPKGTIKVCPQYRDVDISEAYAVSLVQVW